MEDEYKKNQKKKKERRRAFRKNASIEEKARKREGGRNRVL